MGRIKVRNGMDLTEAEGIKKRWQQYTEKLYKKDFQDQRCDHWIRVNILEWEVKWVLGSITMKKS